MCDRCGFSSNKKHNLNQHIAAQHEKIFHHCDKCDFKSFYMHKLKKHMQIVHAGILLSCNLLPSKTQAVSALRTHKKTTHSICKSSKEINTMAPPSSLGSIQNLSHRKTSLSVLGNAGLSYSCQRDFEKEVGG